MNKYIHILFAFLLGACAPISAGAAGLATPTLAGVNASPYHTPTATIDYGATVAMAQGTSQMAELTAQAAERLNVGVTADAERREFEALQMTSQAEQRGADIYNLTAQAAPTSIPLTSTAQAVNWTAIADYNKNVSGQLTATKEAPTQIYLADRAFDEAKAAPLDLIARMFGMLGIGFGGIALAAFLFIYGRQATKTEQVEISQPIQPVTAPAPPAPVVLEVRRNTTGPYKAAEFISLPCTPEELTIICDEIMAGRTWGYNQWSKNPPIKYRKFIELRKAALDQKLLMEIPRSDGQVMQTALGDAVFGLWYEKQEGKIIFEEQEEQNEKPKGN